MFVTCARRLVAPATGTTSHLWTHLYRKHREAHNKLKQEDTNNKSKKGKRPTASSSEADDNKKQCLMSVFMPKRLDASKKKQAYDMAVLKFMVADMRPFEITARVGFQNLCAVITDSAYKPPHPTALSRKLNEYIRPIRFEDSIRKRIGWPIRFEIRFERKKTIRRSLDVM